MEEKVALLADKMVNILNTIIDKGTGPEAKELLGSFFVYVMIQNIMYLVLAVAVICLYLYYVRFVVRKWKQVDKDEECVEGAAFLTGAGVMLTIPVGVLTAHIPMIVASIYDPRLYLVFKVIN